MKHIEIGYVKKLHGYKGELFIHLFEHIAIRLDKLKFILIEINGTPTPFFLKKFSLHKNGLLVYCDGMNGEAQARMYLKHKVYAVDKTVEIIEKESWDFLIGFQLVDGNKTIGKIIQLEEMPMQTMLVVEVGDKDIMIPLHEDFVKEISATTKQVIMKLPEGLVDAQL